MKFWWLGEKASLFIGMIMFFVGLAVWVALGVILILFLCYLL